MVNGEDRVVIDPREFRRALVHFAIGITVVTTVHEGRAYGMTASAFVLVALDPPLVLVSVDNRAQMRKALPESKRHRVSPLSDQQQDLSKRFAGRAQGGTEIPFVERRSVPMLDGALTHMVCDVTTSHPAGDHTLYAGRVEYLDYRENDPLVFYTGVYRNPELHLWDHSFAGALS